MVDPNRKINHLTADDVDYLRECEEQFAYRYNEELDEDYRVHCEMADELVNQPPIVFPWQGRRPPFRGGGGGGRGGGGDRGFNQHRHRGGGGGYNNNYRGGGGGNGGYHRGGRGGRSRGAHWQNRDGDGDGAGSSRRMDGGNLKRSYQQSFRPAGGNNDNDRGSGGGGGFGAGFGHSG